ncbi:DUF5819 family protein [Streptomyces sp. NPDC085995]|uniref:DUF5819 family protein n=2 Tax=unclassified Streptomyces TaxID=2593676 RepID=UPI00344082DA
MPSPRSEAAPRPETGPHPEAASNAEPAPRPEPAPNPEAAPEAEAAPHPEAASNPEPAPHPGAAPHPEPAPHPEAAPDAEVGSVPAPRSGASPEQGASGRAAPGQDTATPSGLAALSLPYQIGAALALAVVAVAACVHLGMVFLYVAPSNTVTKQHGKAVDEWIYPEFEQNWKLFAPNPLQQNIGVQVRAETRTADGGYRTTNWFDLSAEDGRAIDGNPLPSHTQQNELRRAFDFYSSTHDGENRSTGLRGALAEQYLRRIVVLRLGRDDAAGRGGVLQRVQIRVRTTNVPSPEWSEENVSTAPEYRLLPWWTVPDGEARGGVR